MVPLNLPAHICPGHHRVPDLAVYVHWGGTDVSRWAGHSVGVWGGADILWCVFWGDGQRLC